MQCVEVTCGRQPAWPEMAEAQQAQPAKRARATANPTLGSPEYASLWRAWRAGHRMATLEQVLGPNLAKELVFETPWKHPATHGSCKGESCELASLGKPCEALSSRKSVLFALWSDEVRLAQDVRHVTPDSLMRIGAFLEVLLGKGTQVVFPAPCSVVVANARSEA
jgi:hypothetical protein